VESIKYETHRCVIFSILLLLPLFLLTMFS
jgi:hypothetical protein